MFQGFRKIETDRWEFANDDFIKGQKHLLKNIIRRKHSQGIVQRKSSEQKANDVDVHQEKTNVVLWKEVENLKTDKNMLMQELVTLRQHQQTSQSKLLLLREQLKGMEKNQQQMLSFIVMAMQSPGFLVQLLQPKENNWRVAESGKNILEEVTEDQETVPSDGMIVRYQPPTDESREPFCMPSSDSENLLELDLSSDEVKDLFMNIDFMLGTLDGEFPSSENHGPLVLPDLPHEDDMMEQLLLSNPLPENDSGAKLDTEDLIDAGMEMESTFSKPYLKESDQFKNLTEGMEEYQMSMELLVLETQLNNSHNM